MQGWRKAAAVAALGWTAAWPAAAADGRIDSFSASALQVRVNDWVGFDVAYSVEGWSYLWGGSAPEPAPQEGYQEWVANWYQQESETLQQVTLQAAGQSYIDSPGVPLNGRHTGSWHFDLQFAAPGLYQVGVGGDWSVWREVSNGAEVATRNCTNLGDPDLGVVDLACDSWWFSYPQYSESGSMGGTLGEALLQIEVLAGPEPSQQALLGLGLLAMGAALRRRRVS